MASVPIPGELSNFGAGPGRKPQKSSLFIEDAQVIMFDDHLRCAAPEGAQSKMPN
jgi:hypothetical protein